MNKFSERLKDCLIEKGYKQKALAKGIGVSESTVSDWLNKKKQPTADNIVAVAKFLSVSCDYLLGLKDY
jgi:transcriptional regulator with XRE-family HTH domain